MPLHGGGRVFAAGGKYAAGRRYDAERVEREYTASVCEAYTTIAVGSCTTV